MRTIGRKALCPGLLAPTVIFALFFLGGCNARGGSAPGMLERGWAASAPTAAVDGGEIPESVHRARRLIREHQRGAALAVLEPERPLSYAEAERSWLLVALMTESHQWEQARDRVRRLPATPFAAALRALVAERPVDSLQELSGWMQSGSPWVHLAASLAHGALGDDELAYAQSTQALRGASRFVRFDAYLVRARSHVNEGRLEQAGADVAAAIQANPRDARGHGLLGEVLRRRGEAVAAVEKLFDAYQRAPGSDGYARRIAELVRNHEDDISWPQVASRLHDVLALRPGPPAPEGEALQALVNEQLGRSREAIGAYRRALAGGAIPVPVERSLRRLLAADGQYAEVVRLLERAVPPDAFTDECNLRRGHWSQLRMAAAAAPDARADARARLELARALVGVGALEASIAVLKGLDTPDAEDLRAHVEGHVAFEQALQQLIERGYRVAHRKADPPSFSQVLRALPALAEGTLHPDDRAAFSNPVLGARHMPLIGSWLDHHTRTSSPVVRHFRKYGKFLMIGQRAGAPTEAIVMSLGSLTHQQRIDTPRGALRHDVATGYDRTLRGFIDAEGGALGGACLADGVWLDADATRRVEAEIRRALAHDPTLASRVEGRAPLAADTPEGPFALTDTGGASARMILRYARRRGASPWGSFGTLRAHEFSHVADIHRHLPIMRGLPASISLLGRNGFSPARIETELERRAQLGAVVLAPDPDLAVVEMMRALPVMERDPEVHDGGYRDGLALMMRNIYARPDLFPQIDRSKRIVSQLDRLSNRQLRQAAALALR